MKDSAAGICTSSTRRLDRPHTDSKEQIRLGFAEDRCEQLSGPSLVIEQSRQLVPGFAGQMWGRLGISVTQRFRKFDLAKLRPFMRQQYERG